MVAAGADTEDSRVLFDDWDKQLRAFGECGGTGVKIPNWLDPMYRPEVHKEWPTFIGCVLGGVQCFDGITFFDGTETED